MTLGCGSYGGNITSDNIGPVHLMNIKRVAWETKPLAKSRETSAWRPAVPLESRSREEFPYQKALSSEVSRKGTVPAAAPAATVRPITSKSEAAEQKFGTSGMSSEQVDRLMKEFKRTRPEKSH